MREDVDKKKAKEGKEEGRETQEELKKGAAGERKRQVTNPAAICIVWMLCP